jgi:hypothetical protein
MWNLFDSVHGLSPYSTNISVNIIISNTPFKKSWGAKAIAMLPFPDADFWGTDNQPRSP